METTFGFKDVLIVLPAFFVSAGIVFYTGIQAVVVGFVGHRERLYLAFALTCFCMAGFQIATIWHYLANSVPVAAETLRWQTAFALLFHPAFFVFVALYTKQRQIKPWLIAVAVLFGALLIVNFASPYSLRFSALEPATALVLPWGETLARFTGTASLGNGFARTASLGVFLWAIWRSVTQLRGGEQRAAWFLAICAALIIATDVWGTLIDLNVIDSFYVTGFAFLGFAYLISVDLGLELRDRTAALEAAGSDLRLEIKRRKKIEAIVKHIAAGASSETGKSFFQRLVAELTTMFNADYAFIGALEVDGPQTVTTLAVHAHGRPADNMTYSLEHTPCANVVGKRTCVHAQGVCQEFPQDLLLRDMGADSYIGTPMFDTGGQPLGLIVVLDSKPMQDTALIVEILEIFAARAAAEIQRLRSEEQMRRMAYQDYLTGLGNRRQLHERLSEAFDQAERSGKHGAMLLIDLDHFKTINDALGHDIGDQVLREVARRLTTVAVGDAFVARLGGDEFVLMTTTSMDQQEAAMAVRRLAEATMKELSSPFTVGERILNVGASIGIAPFPSDGSSGSTTTDILRHADMALYRAKHLGRNGIQFYEPDMHAAADERLELERGLRAALENDEFILHFQPFLDSVGRVIGAEALLRWRHPQTGVILPASFIPVAEETGLIHAIGAWVLDQVCERLIVWQKTGAPFCEDISVNVSPWQFARPDYVGQVSQILARHRVEPRHLTLEITETALLYDIEETIEKLKALRAMGLKVSLDDFGTGYSSLAYLKKLPMDQLKIDKSFVQDIEEERSKALVGDMISIGNHMRLDVIAEGVELRTQRDILAEMGCGRFQGFLFCRPLAEQDFLRWLAENRMKSPHDVQKN